VGKSNGLTLLLDAETFDYLYQIKLSQGRAAASYYTFFSSTKLQ
jgi:hypothetical protein